MVAEQKKAIPMMVEDGPDPAVERVRCCDNQTGMVAKITAEGHESQFWLLRDMPGQSLATRANRIQICRGCYSDLAYAPVLPWEWGLDKQIDDHLRIIGREIAQGVTGQ